MAYRMPLRAKQWLIIVHVLSVVCWLGGAICMLALGCYLLKADTGEYLYYTVHNMHVIDTIMIRFTALIALLTGILLSVWTQWGLFKHYWIVIKLILTLAFITFGIFFLGNWLSHLVSLVDQDRVLALQDQSLRGTIHSLIGGAIANITALVFMTAISYLKPFGKLKNRK